MSLYSWLSLLKIDCLFLIRFRISSVIHFCLQGLSFFGMTSFADVTNASLNIFHIDVSSTLSASNLFFTLTV